MEIRFLELAQRELDESVEYYARQLPGLGEAFLVEVLAALERLRKFPSAWHPLSENLRRCLLKRFPYGVIYHLDEREILVIAIAHLHRKPEYWRNRLPK